MYVGRIVAVGRTPEGRNAVMYRVSSRSFPNRRTVRTSRGLAVVPIEGHEKDIFKNPYIAYNAVRLAGGPSAGSGQVAVATNGSQTDPITEKIASGMSIRDALVQSLIVLDYEKDDFNTPRIAVAVARGAAEGWAGIVRHDGLHVRSFRLAPGKAFYFATYEVSDPREEYASDFRAASADDAARWIVSGGRFAELEKPVCSAAALETADGFDLAGFTVEAKNAGGADPVQRAKAIGYSEEEIRSVPESALMGLGCGNPTALADLKEGETVLDLGCGGGLDVFLAARKVGRSGKVIGIDATPAMVEKAKAVAAKAGYENVEFRVGRIEALPLADQSVDMILSNCVMNHAADKQAAFREAWRVLRAGGRMLISDLVTEGRLPPPDTPGLEIWTDWLAVATGRREYLDAIAKAGFREVTILDERHWSSPALAEPLRGKIVSLQLRAHR